MGKKTFEAWLRGTLTHAEKEVYLIKQQQVIVGLYALKNTAYYTEIEHIVISDKKIKPSLQAVLIESIIDRIINKIADKREACAALYISNGAVLNHSSAVLASRFLNIASGHIKLLLNGVLTIENALAYVSECLSQLSLMDDVEKRRMIAAYQATAERQPIELEALLYPVILSDIDIDTWVVPIQPKYAVRLFDGDLANTNLSFFPNAHDFAALSTRNSYYTRSKRTFKTPCRIVWYVCYDEKYTGSGSVRAVSTMLSAEIGTKKELFSKHKKYGVLDWTEIRAMKAHDTLRVFSFDNTRGLTHSVSLNTFIRYAEECMQNKLQLQCPNRIPNTLCRRLLEN